MKQHHHVMSHVTDVVVFHPEGKKDLGVPLPPLRRRRRRRRNR
jgi:hypothetical protein